MLPSLHKKANTVLHVFFLKNTVLGVRTIDYDQKVCIAREDPGSRSEIERRVGMGFE